MSHNRNGILNLGWRECGAAGTPVLQVARSAPHGGARSGSFSCRRAHLDHRTQRGFLVLRHPPRETATAAAGVTRSTWKHPACQVSACANAGAPGPAARSGVRILATPGSRSVAAWGRDAGSFQDDGSAGSLLWWVSGLRSVHAVVGLKTPAMSPVLGGRRPAQLSRMKLSIRAHFLLSPLGHYARCRDLPQARVQCSLRALSPPRPFLTPGLSTQAFSSSSGASSCGKLSLIPQAE